MNPEEILQLILSKLDQYGIPYMITGSFASNMHGVPRSTYDADVVIEAIGMPATWEQALKMVRKGGTVLEFGGCPPETEIKVNTELLHYGQVTVFGAFHATPLHFKRALSLIASGTIDVKPLITRKMKLEEIRDAFELLITSKNDLKIAVLS